MNYLKEFNTITHTHNHTHMKNQIKTQLVATQQQADSAFIVLFSILGGFVCLVVSLILNHLS